ncbi:MAG TPA: branched-chain amino acid ABC transporter permease [Caproiciproducens sp.]|nr:branched-chain amino acid ABC transporter permease [Caproiciproducens sp.]
MMNNKKKRNIICTAVLAVVVLLLMNFGNDYLDAYVVRVLNLCAIYAIIGLSMNLINGFTGLFSLGQAGFMAIGAYTVAIFTLPLDLRSTVFYMEPMNAAIANIHLDFVPALLLGGVLAAAAAFLIGAPVLRLRGDYLAIATLGFSEIIRILITNMQSVTNGALGIKNVPDNANDMRWSFGVAIVVLVLTVLLINSSYGRAFKAIREDDIAAEAMGIGLFRHKVMSFVIGGFFAGIGGGLYASLLGTVDPKQFYFTLTYNFLLIIVMGGMGSISGTVIASFIVTGGLELLRYFDEPLTVAGYEIPLFRAGFSMVIFSVLLMVIVLFFRNGLMGRTELSWDRIFNFFARMKNRIAPKTAKGDGTK